jgi:hypothetical protein
VKRWAAALALAALLAGCSDDGGNGDEQDATAATTTSTTLPASAVRVNQLLVRSRDVAPGFTPVVVSRPFRAMQAPRIRLCDEDLRAELRVIAGRQSRFSDGEVEVSHTVTTGGDTNAFLERFASVVDGCPGPWAEPALPTGGGRVTREITGRYPLPETGVDGAAAVVRSRNNAGSTDTVVVVLVQGPIVSSLSVSGPLGSDFDVVDRAVVAAAGRLGGGQSEGGP